jgi:hypothetical protein
MMRFGAKGQTKDPKIQIFTVI